MAPPRTVQDVITDIAIATSKTGPQYVSPGDVGFIVSNFLEAMITPPHPFRVSTAMMLQRIADEVAVVGQAKRRTKS